MKGFFAENDRHETVKRKAKINMHIIIYVRKVFYLVYTIVITKYHLLTLLFCGHTDPTIP